MKNKIARRLTLYFAIVLLLFALISGALFSLMFARHTAEVTARDMCSHAESIAGTLSHFISNYNQGECNGGGFKSYMRFIGDAATGELFLLDRQYQPVTLGEMEPPDSTLPEASFSLVDRVFSEGSVICESYSTSLFHADNLIAAAPVRDKNNDVLYALLLRAPLGSIDHILRNTFYILTACLCIAMALTIIISIFLSHRFVTPLTRMKDVAVQLAGGDYSAKTGIAQNDEIGVLARQIDALSARLDETEKVRHQLDQMRQDFFSDISHELRTPISVLKGSIELLREGIVSDPQQQQAYYDQLDQDATHLERLVNDLLELTRLQNIHFRIEMSIVNLMDILHDTIRSMAQRAAAKQISITLSEEIGPFPVLGDYTRLRQLMVILLDNAIKFSPAHSDVRLTARRTAAGCEVTVCDHGCGIDKDALEHIFDRFFHSRSSLNHSGTGLGLPIAKEIALRHLIDISCDSTPGKGTCFTLIFPESEIPQE